MMEVALATIFTASWSACLPAGPLRSASAAARRGAAAASAAFLHSVPGR